MSSMDLDLLIATILAFGLGLTRTGWRGKFVLCAVLAVIARGLRAIDIYNGDVSVAEDYFNGLTFLNATFELAVAIAWAGLSCVLGTVVALGVRRIKSRA